MAGDAGSTSFMRVVGEVFINSSEAREKKIREEIATKTENGKKTMDPTDLAKMQLDINEYNVMITAGSTVNKSITDLEKGLLRNIN